MQWLRELRGVVSVLLTPFDENGDVDPDSLRRLIDFELECGVVAVTAGGIAGESLKMLDAEQLEVLRVTVEHVQGRVPVLFAVSGKAEQAAIRHARKAADLGAEAFMLMPPGHFDPRALDLDRYLGAFFDAVGLPVMLQEFPPAGVSFTAKKAAALCNHYEQIAALKIESVPAFLKVGALKDTVGDRVAIFTGYGGLGLYEELRAGASGNLPGAGFSDGLKRVIDVIDSDPSAAFEHYRRVLPFQQYFCRSIEFALSCQKHLLVDKRIFRTAKTRNPGVTIRADEHARLQELLKRAELKLATL